eukprot:gene56921-biopygen27202
MSAFASLLQLHPASRDAASASAPPPSATRVTRRRLGLRVWTCGSHPSDAPAERSSEREPHAWLECSRSRTPRASVPARPSAARVTYEAPWAPASCACADVATRVDHRVGVWPVCIREDDNGCITGDAGRSSAHSVTWFEAVDLCNVRGMRLCTKEEVLSQLCCRKGCWYDSLLTWTSSTIPSRRTASAYRCPSTVNVSVSTVCAALPSDVQCWVTWADVCGASPPHEPPK